MKGQRALLTHLFFFFFKVPLAQNNPDAKVVYFDTILFCCLLKSVFCHLFLKTNVSKELLFKVCGWSPSVCLPSLVRLL